MENKFVLSAGFGRTDITPTERVPLAGYGNTSCRMSTVILDFLYASCVAFTDNSGETVLMYHLDLTSPVDYRERYIPAIAAITGVKENQIFLSNTHNHSAPDLSNKNEESILRYCDFLEEKLIEAAKAALADRKPVAKMQIGSIETEGLNFVRRYVLEDGTYAGDNYGHFKESPIASHESEADHTLQVMKFCREGGKDIMLGNFQMHPHRTGGARNPIVSSDIIGVMQAALEKDMDVHFAYFTGGSGNVNGHSRVPEENITPDHTVHGKAMAEYVKKIQLRDAKIGPIRAGMKNVQLEINHADDYRAEEAKAIYEEFKASGMTSAEYRPLIREKGYNSPYHALHITLKAQLESHKEMPIWAFSVGDVGFAFAPYEMYDTNGSQIKAGSPYEMTFVCTCTNDKFSYIPSALGFDHGGYSVDCCRFVPGTGEMLAEEYVSLLKNL